ncbi:MAG: class I SAM-dependent methyltransferase [Acidimicrobiaceae bacterium]|nr:class I SAM-dependent methyltransferase [Ilumatobacter sp.]MCB9382431.1 class I SAM-dependent methyltransferase [Acidimicrobiaceae bacterium]MCO5328566.1 class I SAM-dependent methyltransferase [Ilumatobacteraceae bacterium]
MTPDELLAAAYALDGPDANRALYAQWAATYDSGFIVDSGYQYHEQVAEVFANFGLDGVGADEAVVDIGCGTGLAGQALRRATSVAVDGIDISPEMLAQAAAKRHDGVPVYRTLIEADLTAPLAIPAGTYAGAISVGTFTHGHVGPQALAHVLALLRPGGRAAIGINAAHFASAGFGPALGRLVSDGRIADLHLVTAPIYQDADMEDPDRVAHVAVITVC